MKKSIIFAIGFFLIIFSGCSQEKIEEPEYKILAKVGDRVITVDEFIKRAEYTIRPPYCKNDYGMSKKIILNSLIAEKLLAQEVNPDSAIEKGSHLAKYVQGRQEQAMRRFHYFQKGRQKVKLDTIEVKKVYKMAGRKYYVKYFNFPTRSIANDFMNELAKHDNNFRKVLESLPNKGEIRIPEMEVKFNTSKDDVILTALFNKNSDSINSGDIIGPLETHDKNYVIMQIDSINYRVAMSGKQSRIRYSDVEKKLKQNKAKNIYAQYVQELMAGKKMQFNKQVFGEAARIFSQIYSISQQKNKQGLSNAMWGKNIEQELSDSLGKELNSFNDRSFFTVGEEEWTVADFREELLSHPLVFRSKDINSNREFAKQFRLAIADLIRDQHITQDAYDKGYDQTEYVQNYTDMWRDEVLATYGKYEYLHKSGFQENFGNNYMKAINDHLNVYVDSLQSKYNNEIYINIDAFNDIRLTRIDLFALESNAAYPIVVPGFPILTTDSKLDYGQKLEE